jgi:DNA modification methylase
VLRELPSESIDWVVTSPPYWRLRDYGANGQIGLEATYHEYVNNLCNVFDEVKRVLTPQGTCWINMGDVYIAAADNCTGRDPKAESQTTALLPKCLAQLPSRFAIAMCRRGWILRNEIIWHKPNAMPSSVRDRFTVDFEKLFFFPKSKRYWFDADSVREPHGKDARLAGLRRAREFGYGGKGTYQDSCRKKYTCQNSVAVDEKVNRRVGILATVVKWRNKRCVWSIPTQSFFGNHYAVYPEKLVEIPIQAGCPETGIVLDPFIGSGTTAIVARRLGRNYLGIELNPYYVKLAELRIAEHAG